MVLATRQQRPHGPQGGLATQTSGRIGPIPRFGTILVLALLAMGSPAAGQQLGPNVAATTGLPIQNEPQVAAFGSALVAVWFRDDLFRFSGWGLSTDGGGTWVDGGAFPLANPSLHETWGQTTVCVDHTGRFYAATLYSESGMGIALYRGVPQAGSLSWEGPIYAIPPTVFPDIGLQYPFDAVRLTCDPERGYLYLSYTRTQTVASDQYEYTIQFLRSLDGGTSWSAPLVLSSGIASNGSRPAVGPQGQVYVAWEDFATRQMVGRRSGDFGASFGPPFVVGEVRDNLGTRPPYWMPLVRYNSSITPSNWGVASNFPSLAVDRSTGPFRGRIYATWTDYAEGVVGPRTGGTFESEPNDGFGNATPVEIGHTIFGSSLSPDHGGGDLDRFTFMGTPGTTIEVTGRITSVFPQPNRPLYQYVLLGCGEDTLQITEVALGGSPLSGLPGPPPTRYTLTSPGPYYLLTASGSQHSFVYEIYLRAVSLLTGQAALDHRDIVLTWSDDGGATWAPKLRAGDAPPGYDESFPAVAVDEMGRVHLAWYDRRDDPGCGELANTYWAFSVDGGASFGASRRLSTQGSSWRFGLEWNGRGSNIGDHLGLATSGAEVHVLWTDTRGVDADIYAVRIADVPTGIAVPRFSAEAAEGFVRLSWTVADAAVIHGFRLHRAEGESGVFESLDPELRPTRGAGEYQAEDRSVLPGSSYRYRLEVVRDGRSEWEGPASVSLPARISRLAWKGASPNPFARVVRLELAVPRASEGWVRVYDLAGHEVATIYQGAVLPGAITLNWEGRDQTGRPVAAGVYLLRADFGGERVAMRVVLVR